jgi:hypothetical protein
VFVPALHGVLDKPQPRVAILSESVGNPNTSNGSLLFAPLLIEPLQALQTEVRGFLNSYIPQDRVLQARTMVGEAEVPLGRRARLVFERRGLITVVDSTPKAVLAMLGLLLTLGLPSHALLRCPECDRVVLRHRKNQDYCSQRCVTRVNQRQRRAVKSQHQPAVTP